MSHAVGLCVQQYGRIESIHIVKDRKTGGSRGLAYVRFSRAYDAAVALETCDQSEIPSCYFLSLLSQSDSTMSFCVLYHWRLVIRVRFHYVMILSLFYHSHIPLCHDFVSLLSQSDSIVSFCVLCGLHEVRMLPTLQQCGSLASLSKHLNCLLRLIA